MIVTRGMGPQRTLSVWGFGPWEYTFVPPTPVRGKRVSLLQRLSMNRLNWRG